MFHLIVIFILGTLVGMYMGKTIKGTEDKQRKMMKVAVDVLILIVLIILLVGVYLFLIKG